MILIRRPKITVDCFTYSPTVHELFPIAKATEYYPEWWKATPSSYLVDGFYHKPTIKACTGIIEYYKSGYTIPLWTDISFDINNGIYKWMASDSITSLEIHPNQEMNNYIDPTKFGHIKIHSPWAIKTKSDINWIYSDMYWNYAPINNYSLPPGILNYKYQHTSHINLFLPLEKNKQFVLKAGDPMVHLIPITEKEIILKNHLVSLEEFNKYFRDKISFLNSYKKIVGIIKNKKKCPFGF